MGHPQWVSFPGNQKPKEAESVLYRRLLFLELRTSHLGTCQSISPDLWSLGLLDSVPPAQGQSWRSVGSSR